MEEVLVRSEANWQPYEGGGQTRVNLKHLLEDIRDSYPFTVEEAIIGELVANALDSGASTIRFLIDPEHRSITCLDNGDGMTRQQLQDFHDIASSNKVRGKGIGFAGLGAKLALLIGTVLTESKRGQNHYAARWLLRNPMRAPWEFLTPTGMLSSSEHGTAVRISLDNPGSNLLSSEFIKTVIQNHFHPLLDPNFWPVLINYKSAVRFYVNGSQVQLSSAQIPGKARFFQIRMRRKQVGIGYICKSADELDEKLRGIAISTYGKVIKRGWDWLGITPKNPAHLSGIVEVPDLAEILTAHKADFLRDTTSLAKYYRYRKAIQEAIKPVLRDFGEVEDSPKEAERNFRPLEKEIEKVLERMIDQFPELSPLLGKQKRSDTTKIILEDPYAPLGGTLAQGVDKLRESRGENGTAGGREAAPEIRPEEQIAPSSKPSTHGNPHEGLRKRPGLMLSWKSEPAREELGWLEGEVLFINEGHPASKKCQKTPMENYHIALSVAWVLSDYVDKNKKPQTFISNFLSIWGSGA